MTWRRLHIITKLSLRRILRTLKIRATPWGIFHKLFRRLRTKLLSKLDTDDKYYRQLIYNNMDNLHKCIQKGDLVLVEGRTELSKIIKHISSSPWSHVAMYVGDELIQKDSPYRERYKKEFGEKAGNLIVEALTGKGVVVSSLDKYQDYNIRISRPYKIRKNDLQVVLQHVINSIGLKYDQQNIVDIALMLMPRWLVPRKRRNVQAWLGSKNVYQVICSGMIARAFQLVGYPVSPALSGPDNGSFHKKTNPYGTALIMRHYSQILPRDFDLSPNFEIIKFNIISAGTFDYRALPWGIEEGPA
ncbi:MAG: hypothetical protein DWQ05_21975 [Calditrichaeota bacterium]|nr:MAG: hypothetical protein DWQ05_21975 [Calditrichota bacterium]